MNRQIKILCIVICSASFLSLTNEFSGLVNFPFVQEKNLNNAILKNFSNGESGYTISDLTYADDRTSMSSDIILSFNTESSHLVKDETKKYKISYADYVFKKGLGQGGGCAEFFKGQNRVEIESAHDLWLGSCEDLGSFTIEFRFYPKTFRLDTVIFSRIGFYSGSKRGIEVILNHGRIQARFYGMFVDSSGRRLDIFLNAGQPISLHEWHHFSVSFDRISGRLSKFIDGSEEETVYAADGGLPFNSVYTPTFGSMNKSGEYTCSDLPLTILGKNFCGYIDEFRITYHYFTDIEQRVKVANRNYQKLGMMGRNPHNIEGIVTSPIYSFLSTGTKVIHLDWDEELLPDTFIWMEFRIADNFFHENDKDLKWYRVKKGQKKIFLHKLENGEYLRGKYYQWRAHLVPSPDGTHAPICKNIRLQYQTDTLPAPPAFLKTVSSGDEQVTITWKKNIEHDILGYRIYYGVRPNQYDGIISVINGKRINNALLEGNSIEITITNTIIEENKLLYQKELYSFPVLSNTVLYYFSVSAYDSYKPDTPYNHESELSKQVTGRPFGGSEIN